MFCMNVMAKCNLNVELNTCPYFHVDGSKCSAEQTNCAFRKTQESVMEHNAEYKREPRWYEQYYRK